MFKQKSENIAFIQGACPRGEVRGVIAAGLLFEFFYLFCFVLQSVGIKITWICFAIFLIQSISIVRYRVFFLKYIWFIVMMTWLVFAVALLEGSPVWLNELQKTTYDNGSLLPLAATVGLLFYFLLFLETIRKPTKRLNGAVRVGKEYSYFQKTLIQVASVAALAIALLAFFAVVGTPAWISSRDRFDYAANVMPEILRSYQSYLVLLIPLAAPSLKTGSKKLFFSVVVVYSLYLIWTGEKFTSLFFLLYVLVLIVLVSKPEDELKNLLKKYTKKIVVVFIALALVFFALVFTQYIRQFGDVNSALSTLEQRIAAQGEVWWGIYDQVEDPFSDERMSEIDDEIEAVFAGNDIVDGRDKGGMWKLMRIIMPESYYSNYLANSTRLTSSTPATLYYYFGLLGLTIGMVMLCALYWVVINAAVNAFRHVRLLEGVLAVYMIKIMHGVLLMSDFGDLINWKTLLVGCVMIAITVARKAYQRQSRPRNVSSQEYCFRR